MTAVYVDPEMRKTEFFQPARSGIFLEHGNRRGTAGHETEIPDYGYRRHVPHRPASQGIEYMSITYTVNHQAARIVTAGRDPATSQRQGTNGGWFAARILNPDPPGAAIRMRSDDADVPPPD